MSLESADFVSGLSPSNPTGPDFVSEGDNHLRLVKNVLQQTFPNALKAFRFPVTSTVQTVSPVTVAFPTDQNKVFPVDATSGAITVNLPDPTSGGTVHEDGFNVTIVKVDASANAVTIDASAAQTINGALTISLSFQGQFAELIWCDTANAWYANVNAVGPDLQAIEALSGTTGALKKTAANTWALDSLDTSLNFAKDNGLVVPSTGFMGEIQLDFDCTIIAARIYGRPSGNAVIDILKSTFAGYPPTASICASAKPTLSSAVKAEDTTLTGWTTALVAGDILRFNLDSVATCTYLGIVLKVRRFP